MPDTPSHENLTIQRRTTADNDTLIVLLDGSPMAIIDLMSGGWAPQTLDLKALLIAHGMTYEAVLAAAWADD